MDYQSTEVYIHFCSFPLLADSPKFLFLTISEATCVKHSEKDLYGYLELVCFCFGIILALRTFSLFPAGFRLVHIDLRGPSSCLYFLTP